MVVRSDLVYDMSMKDMKKDFLERNGFADKGWSVTADGCLVAPDGCLIEDDGKCPHGYVSPLKKMGLI